MKLLRILCWLLLPFFAGTIQSCCRCINPIPYTYSISQLVVHNLSYVNGRPQIVSGSFADKASYGIRVQANTQKIVFHQPPSFSFIQSANATSCDCGGSFHGTATDSIVGINITAMNDFDAMHAAGSDVTSYFFVSDSIPVSQSPLINSSAIFWDIKPDSILLDCRLKAPGINHTSQQFRIALTVSDGRKLSSFTEPVYFQ